MSWTDDFEMPDFLVHRTVRKQERMGPARGIMGFRVGTGIWEVKLSWAADNRIVPYNRKRPVVFTTRDKEAASEVVKALQRRINFARRISGLPANKR